MSDEQRRTPKEWSEIENVLILDRDGWRTFSRYGGLAWNTPITRDDFLRRMALSTTMPRQPGGTPK